MNVMYAFKNTLAFKILLCICFAVLHLGQVRSKCDARCSGVNCTSGLSDSHQCYARCFDDSCSVACFGDNCTSVCFGMMCEAGCDGNHCVSNCTGLACKAWCSGESCQRAIMLWK